MPAGQLPRLVATASLVLLFSFEMRCVAAGKPSAVTLDTPRDFPAVGSRVEWEDRATQIREQVLVSCGLWPLPEKTPLKERVFGKISRDGYSVEKVYLQTCPGFYLAGNLYRPLGRGRGPFPGVLNPHGHWKEGRLADAKEGSIAGRCISLARQGMVAFSYDMVGFNDTHFKDSPTNQPFYELHRQFGTNRSDLLWNISPMGLQTWNSIRALDFLAALPDVDSKRLGCTGESGGGTQTFMLGAIDDRLAAQAPVVMVSHTMQGGCSCENAPGLRVEYSNMEIAAAATPRPQILVAATGDWTKDTLTVEGPSIERVYKLFDASDRFRYVRFDFGHNYNQTSREAVYQWFAKWLLQYPAAGPVKEQPFSKEPDADLRVFPDAKLPRNALTKEQFTVSLKARHQKQWEDLVPHNQSGFEKFKHVMLPAWRHTLQTQWSKSMTRIQADEFKTVGSLVTATLRIARYDEDSPIQATYWAPANIIDNSEPRIVVLANLQTNLDNRVPPPGARAFVDQGLAVLLIQRFSSNDISNPFLNFYTTYNRTTAQQRVRDLLTVCAGAGAADPRKPIAFKVILAGTGRAGLWALLAAPGADAVAADCDGLEVTEEALLAPDLFCPGLLAVGGFEGAAMLAAPHPLLLYNAGGRFPVKGLRASYAACQNSGKLRIDREGLNQDQVLEWIRNLD
jgi:hypothetical protein